MNCTDEMIQEMVEAIVKEVSPEQVILFGSRAVGNAKPNSDVDLLIVEAEPFGQGRSRRKELGRILKALLRFAVPIDVLLYAHEEVEAWKNSPSHVASRAIREGRVLYGRP